MAASEQHKTLMQVIAGSQTGGSKLKPNPDGEEGGGRGGGGGVQPHMESKGDYACSAEPLMALFYKNKKKGIKIKKTIYT